MSVSDMSPPPSPPHSHSNEIEHRITRLEITGDRHSVKLSLHERAILGIASALYVLAQDQFPKAAAIIRGILIP